METIIAVEVQLQNGGSRFFLTWGRIQDTVDPNPVARIVLQYANDVWLGADEGDVAVRARVCPSLRDAADSSSAPYFFEYLGGMQIEDDYYLRHPKKWKKRRKKLARQMAKGQHLVYLGNPNQQIDRRWQVGDGARDPGERHDETFARHLVEEDPSSST